jgi:hypothetical protein
MKDPEEQLEMVVEELRAQNDIRSDEWSPYGQLWDRWCCQVWKKVCLP